MVELYILGPAELRADDGKLAQSFLSGPKRLALLTYLAIDKPQGFKRRDTLLPLFWPERNEKSARNALSNMLYHIRQALGKDIIRNRGKDEIELGTLWCDVNAFEEALAEGNIHKANKLYRGNLLESLHVPDTSQKFEQWLDLQREHLQQSYLKVLEILAEEAKEKGDTETAAKFWYEHTRKDPYNSRSARRLIEVLVAEGKRPEAMQVAHKHARVLEDELGADAEREFQKLTNDLEEIAEKSTVKTQIDLSELDPRSVAILPFENLNRGDDIIPFATGIHNDLLARLSNVSALKVIARTSVLRYRDRVRSISEIARELKVGSILEGSLQNTGKEFGCTYILLMAEMKRSCGLKPTIENLPPKRFLISRASCPGK